MEKANNTFLETQTFGQQNSGFIYTPPKPDDNNFLDIITTTEFAEIVQFLESRISGNSKNLEFIYHYTTLEALLKGIISENKSEEITFWATNSNHMNDPKEFKIDLENFYEDVKHIKYFSSLFEKNYFTNNLGKSDNAYLLSFSENKDFLPMWNMYAKNGNGVVLEFEKQLVALPETPLVRCLYPRKEIYNETIKFLEKIFAEGDKHKFTRGRFFLGLDKIRYKSSTREERRGRFKSCNLDDCDNCCKNLCALVVLSIFPIIAYKHNAYEHEKELRLIIFEKDTDKIKFRNKDEMLIPYIERKINRKALKSVIIGPTQNYELSQKSLRMFLDSRGFNDVKIIKSTVPYRN